MNVYSIEGTGEEHYAESAEAPYILMQYPKPSTEHVCEGGTWVLSNALLANSAGQKYLLDTEFYVRDALNGGPAVPELIVEARAAVLASIT